MSNIDKTYTKEQVSRVVGKADSGDDTAMKAKTDIFIQEVRTELIG